MLARVRPAQRDRPLRADRAEGAAGRQRLRAPRTSASTAARSSPRSAPGCRRSSTSSTSATATTPPAGGLDADAGAGLRARAVRPPALRAVLLRHDRAAEGDRPRPRRHPARAPQEPRADAGTSSPGDRLLQFTTTAWMMWNALVSALLLRASIVLLDGDPAWPDLTSQWRVAQETEADDHGRQPRVPDGLPQGRAAAGSRLDLTSIRAVATAGSPLPGRGLRLRLRAARPRRAADQRLRRDRRLQRDRLRLPDAARLPRRDRRPLPRRRHRGVRPRRPRGRRRARRAGDPAADAVDAGALLGRRRRRALPRGVLRHVPGRLAPGRLGALLRAGHLRRHRPLGRDAQPRRCPHGHERALRRGRGVRRRSPTAWSSTSRTTRAAPAS